MPRIAGVDIPEKKKIYFALQYVHGIGQKIARDILTEAKIDPDLRAGEVDETALARINEIIDGAYPVEGALRRGVPGTSCGAGMLRRHNRLVHAGVWEGWTDSNIADSIHAA